MPEESTDLVALVESKVLDALAADEAGDLDRAIELLSQAETLVAFLPDGKREDEEVRFDRESIRNKIAELQRRANAKHGIVSQGVRYERG